MVGRPCAGVKPSVCGVQLNAAKWPESAPNLLMHKEHHQK